MGGMDQLPVVYCLDDKFAAHCAACIASVLKNLSDQYLPRIYVITDSLSADNRRKIQETTKIRDCSLDFIDIDPAHNEFKDFKIPAPWSHSIFYRLKIPSLLENHSKAIYLDSDTILTADISELFNLDISNYLLAAYDESRNDPPITAYFQSKKLNLPTEIGYFNTGVLLLNLAEMRKKEVAQKCLDLLKSDLHPSLSFPDQDVLNIVVNGNYLRLPKTWNTQQIFGTKPPFWKKFFPFVHRYKDLPKIIHFSGPMKPWKSKKESEHWLNVSGKVPYSKQYFKYLAYTPWGKHK